MKIATWNIERLKIEKRQKTIETILNSVDADILVLTETDTRINLANYTYQVFSEELDSSQNYKSTERRVCIYSKYKITNQLKTFDAKTSLCVEIERNIGNLVIYGTIIGIYGNRHSSFNEDLSKQLEDFKNISDKHHCIIGDYNISFGDNYYYTKISRNLLNKLFETNDLKLVTNDLSEAIDHIAISAAVIQSHKIEIEEWNLDKSLSDHKGVSVKFL